MVINSQRLITLYIKHAYSHFTALLIYVDDVVLARNSVDEIKQVKHLLDQKFRIKDLGKLMYFLGFEITRSIEGVFLKKRKYTLALLQDSGVLAAKPSHVPFDPNIKLSLHEGDLLEDPSSYMRLIGRLIYLTNTRPVISFVVQHFIQFMSQPRIPHFQAAIRVLRYLKAVPTTGILFPIFSDLKLLGLVDSDWARCPNTRK